jgi:hypothetical protein
MARASCHEETGHAGLRISYRISGEDDIRPRASFGFLF